jgi:hypothetical protein
MPADPRVTVAVIARKALRRTARTDRDRAPRRHFGRRVRCVGTGAVEHLGNLAQRQPEAAQHDDLVQPPHLGRPVPAPPTRIAPGPEQPEPVIVVQRPDRDAGRPGQGAHGHRRIRWVHAPDGKT